MSQSTLRGKSCTPGLGFDSRPRIHRREGGTKEWIIIRRLKCHECGELHSELPDCLVPHKHYDSEIIAGVIARIVTPDDADSEDYPCEETMKRWLQWYRENKERAEGYLRNTRYRLLNNRDDFLMSSMPLLSTINDLKSGLTGWDISYALFITAVIILFQSGNAFAHNRYKSSFRDNKFAGLKPVPRSGVHSHKLPENFDNLVKGDIQLRLEVLGRSVDQIITILEIEGKAPVGVLKRSTLQRHMFKQGFGTKHLKVYSDARESSSKSFCKPHRMMLIKHSTSRLGG